MENICYNCKNHLYTFVSRARSRQQVKNEGSVQALVEAATMLFLQANMAGDVPVHSLVSSIRPGIWGV